MILARHAESLFWAGRYLERAEVTARWLDVANRFTSSLLPQDAEGEWEILTETLGIPAETISSVTLDGFGRSTLSSVLLTDASLSTSVAGAVQNLRNNVRVVRDRVPVELWEEANRLHLQLADPAFTDRAETAPHLLFRAVRQGCQAISGVLSEAMMRDEGHAFIEIGRMLERSILTVRLLASVASKVPTTFDSDRILRSSTALQAYRRMHGHGGDLLSVTCFLLRTKDLPRSVHSCLQHLESRLASVDPHMQSTATSRQLAGRLRSRLEFSDLETELQTGGSNLLIEIEQGLAVLGPTLSSEVFRPMGDPILHAQYVRPGTAL